MSCWCTSLLVSLLFPICGTPQEGDGGSVCCPPLKLPHESSRKLLSCRLTIQSLFFAYYSPMILCLRHFRKFITFEAFELLGHLLGHLHIQELLQSSKKKSQCTRWVSGQSTPPQTIAAVFRRPGKTLRNAGRAKGRLHPQPSLRTTEVHSNSRVAMNSHCAIS